MNEASGLQIKYKKYIYIIYIYIYIKYKVQISLSISHTTEAFHHEVIIMMIIMMKLNEIDAVENIASCPHLGDGL